jgi:flagellar motor protein MotB
VYVLNRTIPENGTLPAIRCLLEGEMNRTWIHMLRAASGLSILAVCGALPAICQEAPPKSESVPLYRVTVTERNIEAVNYQYRSGPTKIDFRGTVLLNKAKGDATVESKRGRTEIDAHFDNLAAPVRFGREYLTYVLWAITPEGSPHNLGEVVTDSGDHGHLRVTTDLQVFGLIVTAEPFSSVRQPSDVVVLENKIRPDTLGATQPIEAKYELMPRGHYTYDVQASQNLDNEVSRAPKVSMREYEALLQLYEAQNAMGIAQAAGAEQYAPNTFAKAEHAYSEAQRLQAAKGDTSLVVQNAREASEMAEDARVIAERRKESEQLAAAQTEAAQAKAQAAAAVQQAQVEADAARAQAAEAQAQVLAEHQAREQAEAQVSAARAEADRLQTAANLPPPPPPGAQASQTAQKDLRGQLLERLNGELTTTDTPRGIVVTVTDADFTGATLRPEAAQEVSRVASIVASQPGLHVSVEGYSDTAGNEQFSADRAAAVRNALVSAGLTSDTVSSQGLGDSRPVTSNATDSGRIENRRVEIVITGNPIGNMPFWEQSYSVVPPR